MGKNKELDLHGMLRMHRKVVLIHSHKLDPYIKVCDVIDESPDIQHILNDFVSWGLIELTPESLGKDFVDKVYKVL